MNKSKNGLAEVLHADLRYFKVYPSATSFDFPCIEWLIELHWNYYYRYRVEYRLLCTHETTVTHKAFLIFGFAIHVNKYFYLALLRTVRQSLPKISC